jgi:RNA polymerase sigma factor (sigma-70 family)
MTETNAQLDDWELVRQTASGAASAFERLVVKYRKLLACMVFRRGSYLLGFSEVDEIIDETWCQVLERISVRRYKESARFSTWLVGLLLNVLKDKRFRPFVGVGQDEEGAGFLERIPSPDPLPDKAADEAELFVALSECLEDQPGRLRDVYEMIYVQGMTKVSAAEQMGCSEANVRQKLLPALHEGIGDCLGRKGFR